MSTSTDIVNHIDSLKPDALFTTRDMLSYGTRAAVDQTLYRLVNVGAIKRLARGVFILNRPRQRKVDLVEIARVKAAAFGKQLITHAHDCAIKMKLLRGKNKKVMFEVSGHSSSFRCNGARVILQGVSGRKLALGDSRHGMLMRAFWYMESKGYKKCPDHWTALRRLKRCERLEIQKNARWIPAWLSDSICHWSGKTSINKRAAPT